MKTLIDPNLLQRLRVGPLAPYLDAYLKHIEQQGFLPSSAPMQMYANRKYDCRYSHLTLVFGKLLPEGRVGGEELCGLGEDKLEAIRS